MQEETRHSRALYQVAAAMNSTLEPGGVLMAIVCNIAQAMGVKGCSIMLLGPDGQELQHSAHYGLSDKYVAKGPVMVDSHLSETLMKKPVTVLHASTDPLIQYRDEAIAEGVVSMLSVPIRLRGEVLGVMRVYTAEPREFSQDDVDFVEAVADLGAIALDNASRYAQATMDLEQLRSYVLRYGGS